MPELYEELRQLARRKVSGNAVHNSLTGTALLHEAYIRLGKEGSVQKWESKQHFYWAAAETMRRILIDRIRAKNRQKRGGAFEHVEFDEDIIKSEESNERLLEIDEALGELEVSDPEAAKLVKLRFFAGLTLAEISDATGVSSRTLHRQWAYARAWLARRLSVN